MLKTMKTLTLCSMIVVMLLLQLVSPTPARADGGTPPPATDVVSTSPDTDQQEPAAPTPAASLEPATETAQENNLVTTSPVQTTAQTEVDLETSLFEAAQAIADDTNVVVLDEEGEALPLASQEAAEVIANSDPVWCPAGQVPTPGANGCTTSYATLTDLVANEGGNIAEDGTIWMTSGLIPEAGNVTINGSTYTTWSNYALTLQGGWSGASGDQNIGSNTVFSVPIAVINWNNNIFVNNINIENVVTSGVDWLEVQTNSGDITISHSNISNNTNMSALTAGVSLYTTGNATIEDSNFDNNIGSNDTYAANLTITNANGSSITSSVPLTAFAPAIFSVNQQGTGQGIVTLANSSMLAAPPESVPGAASQPAVKGNFITIYCTGLGAVNNPPASGAVTPDSSSTVKSAVTVLLNGASLPAAFAGLSPGSVGLFQVDVQIPDDAASGNAVSLALSVGGAISNTVAIAIQ